LVLGEMREVGRPSVWVYTRAGRKVETVMEWNGKCALRDESGEADGPFRNGI